MKTSLTLFLMFLIGSSLAGCDEPENETTDLERPQLYVLSGWMRQPIAGRDMTAAYMTIGNSGTVNDTLVSAQSNMAERVEIHTTLVENGIASMKKMDAVSVPIGEGLAMAPGGAHLMVFGLKKDFKDGEAIYMSLSFETSDPITMKIPVLLTPPKQD